MIDPFIYFLLFFKASLFSSGGFSNLPSLHQDLIADRWANESNFSDSIAIGQVSPGPNGLWVISLGYLTLGFLGAFLTMIAITLPPLLILVVERIYSKIEHQHWVPGLMRGISLAVSGTFISIFITTSAHANTDWKAWLICAIAFGLVLSRRVNILVVLILAGCAGYLQYR
jgi:chromate transporter